MIEMIEEIKLIEVEVVIHLPHRIIYVKHRSVTTFAK